MPQSTVLDLITRALRLAGQLGPGRLPNASEVSDALLALNGMMDGWNTDPLKIYTRRIDVYPLIPSKYTYTIGPSGDFDAPRPTAIEIANLILGGTLRKPIELINDQQWSRIKLQTVVALPQRLYNDGSYPLSTLYLWPGPSADQQLELYTWQQLAEFNAQDNAITCPPGYFDAMSYNLAVRLGLEWAKPVRPEVASMANSTLADIKALNLPNPVMSADSAVLVNPRGGAWNWLTGENQ
jgi:hypothetical protein